MIGKDQLVFDTTDATAIAHSDSVGAFVRSSDGTLISHTTVGGKQALDVYVTEGINVEVDLAAAEDSVSSWMFDGAGTALTSTLVGASQALDVNVVDAFDAALANTAIASAAEVLDTADTAQAVVSAPLANRKYLYIRNMDNKQIYIGATGVTAANGFPMSPSSVAELRIGSAVAIEFVGSAGATPEIRTLELS